MSIIEKLSEGIVNRDMKAEGSALLNKWSSTGLLEGLETGHQQATMARSTDVIAIWFDLLP